MPSLRSLVKCFWTDLQAAQNLGTLARIANDELSLSGYINMFQHASSLIHLFAF